MNRVGPWITVSEINAIEAETGLDHYDLAWKVAEFVAKRARADEQRICAKVCDARAKSAASMPQYLEAISCRDAIRARGQEGA